MGDIDDFALLASNFNQALPADHWRYTAVPEPALGVLLAAPLARRRRGV